MRTFEGANEVTETPSPFPTQADTSHATPEAAALFEAYHRAKSSKDVEQWASCFDARTVYADATLGWYYPDRASWHDAVAEFVPHWADGLSYATRVLGDERSAVLAVTDSPQLFGHEIRSLSAVDLVDGKIVRFVDYWDGRHFTAAAAEAMRTSESGRFALGFGEETVQSLAPAVMTKVCHALADALARDDVEEVAVLLAIDVVWEDMTLHAQVLGRLAVARYLARTGAALPYAQHAQVAHVLGDNRGGGYEWRASDDQVPVGLVALELDQDGLITRLTTIWDGSLLEDARIQQMTAWTIEPTA
jgi:ketosteroid isomerase-like protein